MESERQVKKRNTMKPNTKEITNSQPSFFMFISNYIIHPLNEGFFGFGIFLTFLAGSKIISFLFGMIKSFSIDEKDIILSSVGFICLFLVDILKNFDDGKN